MAAGMGFDGMPFSITQPLLRAAPTLTCLRADASLENKAPWRETSLAPVDEIPEEFPGDGLLDLDDLSETTMKLSLPRENRVKRMTIPTIRVVAGPDMLRFASISPGEEILVGRDEKCGLTLVDASVSRYHAKVASDSNGQISVQDLDSTNGTAINNRASSRGLLRPGAPGS